MASFNKVILAGNLTRDPELRYTPKGTAIAQIGLAVNRNWTSESRRKEGRSHFCGRGRLWPHGRNHRPIHEERPSDSDRRPPQARTHGTTRRPTRNKASSASLLETFQFLDSDARRRRRRRTRRSACRASRRRRLRARGRTRRSRRPAGRRRRSVLIFTFNFHASPVTCHFYEN